MDNLNTNTLGAFNMYEDSAHVAEKAPMAMLGGVTPQVNTTLPGGYPSRNFYMASKAVGGPVMPFDSMGSLGRLLEQFPMDSPSDDFACATYVLSL